MEPARVCLLYKHILRAAKAFPSIKRGAVLEEIRAEFRANKETADPASLRQQLQAAVRGLQQLEEYSGLDVRGADWEVSLKGPCD